MQIRICWRRLCLPRARRSQGHRRGQGKHALACTSTSRFAALGDFTQVSFQYDPFWLKSQIAPMPWRTTAHGADTQSSWQCQGWAERKEQSCRLQKSLFTARMSCADIPIISLSLCKHPSSLWLNRILSLNQGPPSGCCESNQACTASLYTELVLTAASGLKIKLPE